MPTHAEHRQICKIDLPEAHDQQKVGFDVATGQMVLQFGHRRFCLWALCLHRGRLKWTLRMWIVNLKYLFFLVVRQTYVWMFVFRLLFLVRGDAVSCFFCCARSLVMCRFVVGVQIVWFELWQILGCFSDWRKI